MLDRVLRISAIALHTARSSGPKDAPLMEVLAAAGHEFLPERAEGVPVHTGATILGLAFLKLIYAHLIQVTVNGNALQVGQEPVERPPGGLRSEELLSVSPKIAADFRAGYAFA